MRTRLIPDNVLSGKRILGFKKRNLIECIIEILILVFILYRIPFVSKVRWILIICIGVAILFANYAGIAGNSPIKTLINFLQYRKYLKPFSYRRIQHGATKTKPTIVNGKVRIIKENRGSNAIKKFFGK